MSINLFKKILCPNTVKKIYFYVYREINKEVARKQHQLIKDNFKVICRRILRVRRYNDYEATVGSHVKDGYKMFKAQKVYVWRNWRAIRKRDAERVFNEFGCPASIKHIWFKQLSLCVYTCKELRGMLRMNKVKGRSKLKTRHDMIVALMNM